MHRNGNGCIKKKPLKEVEFHAEFLLGMQKCFNVWRGRISILFQQYSSPPPPNCQFYHPARKLFLCNALPHPAHHPTPPPRFDKNWVCFAVEWTLYLMSVGQIRVSRYCFKKCVHACVYVLSLELPELNVRELKSKSLLHVLLSTTLYSKVA